jgi:hypothetical protein
MSVTIVFRGLMVFHYMNDFMEIGVLDAAAHEGASHVAHVPRIITTTNGVISSIFDLRKKLLPKVRDWEIEVTNPLQPTATKFIRLQNFNRLHHPHARDYRWITDLEAGDLHGRDLTTELDTENKLLMVLKVRHGEFYTSQLSKPLIRKKVNSVAQADFGMAAEVIGCDIAFNLGAVTLKKGVTPIFRFDKGIEDGVIYEFSNAPPDVPHDEPYQAGPGHFAMYYSHLFKQPVTEEFKLIAEGDVTPSPDPALCGVVTLGQRPTGL